MSRLRVLEERSCWDFPLLNKVRMEEAKKILRDELNNFNNSMHCIYKLGRFQTRID
jgi:hypothetical protein